MLNCGIKDLFPIVDFICMVVKYHILKYNNHKLKLRDRYCFYICPLFRGFCLLFVMKVGF